MNTANPQLEGLYLALFALIRQMVSKGMLSEEDVGAAMNDARQRAERDFESSPMSDANRKAVLFPIELLALAGAIEKPDDDDTFRGMARRIARGS